MTRAEAIKTGRLRITSLLAGGGRYSICGRCQTDRKVCGARLNENCVAQYLMSDMDTAFYCDYVRTDTLDRADYEKPITRMYQKHWFGEGI